MSSASEKHSSPMDELLAMQQSALQANLNKASNIQKAVTLTEANWMGLTRAMELTGNSILKAQETLERLPTAQEMETLLAGQAGNLTAAHTEAVQQIQQTVQELLETGRENLRWMQEAMQETLSLIHIWSKENFLPGTHDYDTDIGSVEFSVNMDPLILRSGGLEALQEGNVLYNEMQVNGGYADWSYAVYTFDEAGCSVAISSYYSDGSLSGTAVLEWEVLEP